MPHNHSLHLTVPDYSAYPQKLGFHHLWDSWRPVSSPMASSLRTSVAPQTLAPVSKSRATIKSFKQRQLSTTLPPPQRGSCSSAFSSPKRRFAARSARGELDVLPVQSVDSNLQQDRTMAIAMDREGDGGDVIGQTAGGGGGGGEDLDKAIGRLINASIVLGAGSFAITKLITVDHDYWHGWTVYEILRYAPQHNWIAYEEALKTNPVLAKMVISGIVYSLGDWIAQCYQGKPLFDFDRARLFRSGLVGFALHGFLSHYYYEFCEALFPFKDWWVVPAKVAFDQTVWSAIWNSIYYASVGLLRVESPAGIFKEWKATFWPMLTAGWKLWPFAHLITYGVVPLEQRLLWVDSVELIWVTILSTYSNEKSEARNAEASAQTNSESPKDPPEV